MFTVNENICTVSTSTVDLSSRRYREEGLEIEILPFVAGHTVNISFPRSGNYADLSHLTNSDLIMGSSLNTASHKRIFFFNVVVGYKPMSTIYVFHSYRICRAVNLNSHQQNDCCLLQTQQFICPFSFVYIFFCVFWSLLYIKLTKQD